MTVNAAIDLVCRYTKHASIAGELLEEKFRVVSTLIKLLILMPISLLNFAWRVRTAQPSRLLRWLKQLQPISLWNCQASSVFISLYRILGKVRYLSIKSLSKPYGPVHDCGKVRYAAQNWPERFCSVQQATWLAPCSRFLPGSLHGYGLSRFGTFNPVARAQKTPDSHVPWDDNVPFWTERGRYPLPYQSRQH